MPTYKELAALSAFAYLSTDNFRTMFDAQHVASGEFGYAARQYKSGLEVGQKSTEIHIAVNSVWSARGKDGGHTSSYEGIGYHACTADLLRGFIDSGCKIIVHRDNDDGHGQTVIQG